MYKGIRSYLRKLIITTIKIIRTNLRMWHTHN